MQWKIKIRTPRMTLALGASIVLALLANCRSPLKTNGSAVPPKGYAPPAIEPLPLPGENYGARFSPDGKRILFISRNRSKHRHPQLYEYDLAARKERRVTFQDGEIFDAIYGPKGHILYSSTTDEIKEHPRFLQEALRKFNGIKSGDSLLKNFFGEIFPPTEIYASSPDGREIRRLTFAAGFDGELTFRPSMDEVIFLAIHDGKSQFHKLRLNSGGLSPFHLNSSGEDEFPSFSPNGQWLLWSRRVNDDANKSEIWQSAANGSQSKMLISGNGHHLEAAWHPQGEEILFVSDRDESNHFAIYVAKKDGTCIRRLTYDSGLFRTPQWSLDGKKLLFASSRGGSFQLYMMDYTPPSCPPPSASLQSNP